MGNSKITSRRVLLAVGVVVVACGLLTVGALAVGGAVYALTWEANWPGPWQGKISLAEPAGTEPEEEERGTIIALDAADEEQGIVIGAVAEGSPAAAAGVERGDILLELDGEAVNSPRDLLDALDELEPDDEIGLRVFHGDDERHLTATLDERDGHAWLGLVPCCAIRESHFPMHLPHRQPAGGAIVTDVMEDSPADEAGLESGDVILAVDGEELGDELTLADAIVAYEPGERVTLTVQSPADEDIRELAVELGEHPEKEDVAYLGVTYLTAPPLGGRRFRMPRAPLPDRPHIERFLDAMPEELHQVIVAEVEADSPAEEAGLREGDVILSIDGAPMRTPHDVAAAVTAEEPGGELAMTIRRPDEEDGQESELELLVTLGEHPDHEDRAYLGVRLALGGTFIRPFKDDWDPELRHFEFDLPDDWDLPFDLDELPDHLEFEFPSEAGEVRWKILVGSQDV